MFCYFSFFAPLTPSLRNAVLTSVHPKAKFQKVRLVRLVGMMLIVLVQEKHLAYVRNVAVDTVGTGIMNKMVREAC